MKLEFYAHTPNGGGHVMTVHRDAQDDGPLQFISHQRLVRLERMEAMMEEMLGHPLDAPEDGKT